MPRLRSPERHISSFFSSFFYILFHLFILFIYLFIHITTSSIVPEAISVDVMMTLTENSMKGDGKEEGG